jgi:hypothetical protein
LTEIISNCFSFTTTESGIILFDCKVGNYSLFENTSKAVEFIPFIILNSLSVLSNLKTCSIDKYNSNFVNHTIPFYNFVIYEPNNTPLGENSMTIVKRMNPDGFDISTKNMKKDVYDYAI